MNPEKSTSSTLPASLAADLDAFVFFHLGSDAEVAAETGEGKIRITVRHRRIFPMQIELDTGRIEEFCRHADRFEEFLLDHLTRHRRDA